MFLFNVKKLNPPNNVHISVYYDTPSQLKWCTFHCGLFLVQCADSVTPTLLSCFSHNNMPSTFYSFHMAPSVEYFLCVV